MSTTPASLPQPSGGVMFMTTLIGSVEYGVSSLIAIWARTRATVGEISQALEDVFGRHRAEMRTLAGVYGQAAEGVVGQDAVGLPVQPGHHALRQPIGASRVALRPTSSTPTSAPGASLPAKHIS